MRVIKSSSPSIAYVYGLVCPASHVVRYVGQTTCLDKRYRQHCRGHKATSEWTQTLAAHPALVLLETVHAPGNELLRAARVAETKWIKRFRRTVINKYTRENNPKVWDALVNR